MKCWKFWLAIFWSKRGFTYFLFHWLRKLTDQHLTAFWVSSRSSQSHFAVSIIFTLPFEAIIRSKYFKKISNWPKICHTKWGSCHYIFMSIVWSGVVCIWGCLINYANTQIQLGVYMDINLSILENIDIWNYLSVLDVKMISTSLIFKYGDASPWPALVLPTLANCQTCWIIVTTALQACVCMFPTNTL